MCNKFIKDTFQNDKIILFYYSLIIKKIFFVLRFRRTKVSLTSVSVVIQPNLRFNY